MGMVSAPILQSPQQLHMPLPFSYTNLLLGGNQNLQFTHHLQSTCLNPSLATTPTLNMQGLGMHFDGGNTDAPTEETRMHLRRNHDEITGPYKDDPSPTSFVPGAAYHVLLEAFGRKGYLAGTPDELKEALVESFSTRKSYCHKCYN
ncbi:2-hydroxyacyl- lyase [Olea europaea subsp. europaea]|uniref:2-hydroxyacyl- lyase n=1 Tax=Olea europaea subsp. europaea TaxID=158383 RepID=A0A8S0TPU7_OLEEU|nr:2-hydroxyacyl- lyase [Olea europaea subsp. europaea]